MLARTLAIAANTYREAVRARVLHGLLALAFAATLYAIFLGALSLNQDARVVADVGAATLSLFSVLVAIVLGATSLQREVEYKTLFPILTRKLRRHEFLIGKLFGMILTIFVFVCLDGAAILAILASLGGVSKGLLAGVVVGALALLAGLFAWRKRDRDYIVIPWAAALFGVMALLAEPEASERRLVLASVALTLAESAIVSALALFFSSFSSPFLTAIFTLAVFLIGRSADTATHLPPKVVGPFLADLVGNFAKTLPNLHLFVPPRPLLLGEIPEKPLWPYVGRAIGYASAVTAALTGGAVLAFRKRDLT
jgi:uncharacterized membrane protein